MNKQIEQAIKRNEDLDPSEVKCGLAAISLFGDADLLYTIFGTRTLKFLQVFCDHDSEEDCYSIKKEFTPINGVNVWVELITWLKNNHGFTATGMPPRTFDFNLYQETKTSRAKLAGLIYLDRIEISQIAAAIALYYETTKFPTALGKLIDGPLEGILAAGKPNDETEIEGLV